jgi:hypothetical protein
VDPALKLPAVKIGWRVMQKQLGLRMLTDVIPLDASLVRGTHGRTAPSLHGGPLVIGGRHALGCEHLTMVNVKDLALKHWT